MPRIYLNSLTAELTEPLNGSATVYHGKVEDAPTPFKYRLQCLTCQIKWRAENPTDKCWSCGETKKDPWFSLRGKK